MRVSSSPYGNHIPVRTGVLRLMSTLWKNLCPGIPPSRANAYIIRLFDVIENVPQKNIAPITITCSRRTLQYTQITTHDPRPTTHRLEGGWARSSFVARRSA